MREEGPEAKWGHLTEGKTRGAQPLETQEHFQQRDQGCLEPRRSWPSMCGGVSRITVRLLFFFKKKKIKNIYAQRREQSLCRRIRMDKEIISGFIT